MGITLVPEVVVAQDVPEPLANISLSAVSPTQLLLSVGGLGTKLVLKSPLTRGGLSSIKAEVFPLTSAQVARLTSSSTAHGAQGYGRLGVAEVQRLIVTHDRSVAVSEVQILRVTHGGTLSGTFTLFLDNFATAVIPIDSSALDLQSAINAAAANGTISTIVQKTVNATAKNVEYRIEFSRPYGDVPLLRSGNVTSSHEQEMSFQVNEERRGLAAPGGSFRLFDGLSGKYSDLIRAEPCPAASAIEDAMSAIASLGRVLVTQDVSCGTWNITLSSIAANVNLLALDLTHATGISGSVMTISDGAAIAGASAYEFPAAPYGDIQSVHVSSLAALDEIQNITIVPGPAARVMAEVQQVIVNSNGGGSFALGTSYVPLSCTYSIARSSTVLTFAGLCNATLRNGSHLLLKGRPHVATSPPSFSNTSNVTTVAIDPPFQGETATTVSNGASIQLETPYMAVGSSAAAVEQELEHLSDIGDITVSRAVSGSEYTYDITYARGTGANEVDHYGDVAAVSAYARFVTCCSITVREKQKGTRTLSGTFRLQLGENFPRDLPGTATLTRGSSVVVASEPLDGVLFPGEEVVAMGTALRISYDESAVNGTRVVLAQAFEPPSSSYFSGTSIMVRLKARRLSGPIAYNASVSAVKAELEKFPEVSEANVSRALWHRHGPNFEHLTTWIAKIRPAVSGDIPQLTALPHGLVGSFENATSYLSTSTVQNATRATRGSVVLRQLSLESEAIDYDVDASTLKATLQRMIPNEVAAVTTESRTGHRGDRRTSSKTWTITFAPRAGQRDLLSVDVQRMSGPGLTITTSRTRAGASLDRLLLSTVATSGSSYFAAVFAENDVSYGYPAFTPVAAVASAKVPSAPTTFVFGRIFTNSSLRASWVAPEYDGGQAISSYELQFATSVSTLNVGSPTTVQAGASASATDIAGLALGVIVYARLRACNSVGCGEYTRVASSVPRAAPHKPSSLVTSVASDTMLDVFFVAPTQDSGSTIDSFRVEWERYPGLRAKYVIELTASRASDVPSNSAFTVSFGNFTTAMLADAVSAEDMEMALNRLPSITRCSVGRTLSTSPSYAVVWTVEFLHYEPEHIYHQMVVEASFDSTATNGPRLVSRRTRTTVFGQGYGSALLSTSVLIAANNKTRCYCAVDQSTPGLMLHTIAGLFPDATYLVRVFAHNGLGFGAPREQNVTLSKQGWSSCRLPFLFCPYLPLPTHPLPLLALPDPVRTSHNSANSASKLQLHVWTTGA